MQVRLVCSVFIVWGSITVCVHYVWVVRSVPGWWFGAVTVLRVEGRGWGDYSWSGATRPTVYTLYIHYEIIEKVTQFTYLGSIIDNTRERRRTSKLVYERPKLHLVHWTRSGIQWHTQHKPNFASSTRTWKRSYSMAVRLGKTWNI